MKTEKPTLITPSQLEALKGQNAAILEAIASARTEIMQELDRQGHRIDMLRAFVAMLPGAGDVKLPF